MNSINYPMCFDTLANGLRLQILKALEEKPMYVDELAKKLGVEQSRLSHSLKMLRTCNYVDVKANGKQHIYSIKDGVLEVNPHGKEKLTIFDVMDNHVENFCHNECKKENCR